MSDVQILRNALEKAAGRRRWQRAWNGLWRGLLVGSLLFLLTLAVYKIFPIPYDAVVAAGIAGGVCLLGGFLYGWMRKMSLTETARWLDEQQHLQERLSTALEVAEKPIEHKWQELVTADAAQHVQGLDARKLLPFHLTNATRWAALVLAVSAGLGFVPEYRSKQFVQRENEKQVIKEVGKKLADLTRRDMQARPPALEPTRQSLESIEQLGTVLGKNPVTRTEALKDLANVTDKLKSDLKELGKNPGLKPLERAARASSKTGSQMSGDLQKQMDSLQKALGDKMGTPDQLDQMKEKMEEMKQAMNGMADKNTPEGKAARQQMAQQLAAMAQQMKDMGQSLEGLQEAIEALKANQADMFLKDLNMAMNDLEKLQDMAKQMKQMQQQAGNKIGKDLAEQLKNGQAEAAQSTLKKMMDQLKSQQLSKEDLKKMLEEVSKAVDPASPYGKVAEHLKECTGQLQNGNKPGASESLAKAADELKKLMDQMGDAQSLMAALEACKKAQMCIGNCQGWKQCNSPYVKAGKGGKPGKGVGTWAEESGWLYYPEIGERWDNSGLERPDMDPKAQTDRGEGKLADNLSPEKLRGRMNPGPMPSITLKGVSIKGQSTVGYQEAATAAQSEAQAAINQDQVPRAYRGAVKDYFDDLKK